MAALIASGQYETCPVANCIDPSTLDFDPRDCENHQVSHSISNTRRRVFPCSPQYTLRRKGCFYRAMFQDLNSTLHVALCEFHCRFPAASTHHPIRMAGSPFSRSALCPKFQSEILSDQIVGRVLKLALKRWCMAYANQILGKEETSKSSQRATGRRRAPAGRDRLIGGQMMAPPQLIQSTQHL